MSDKLENLHFPQPWLFGMRFSLLILTQPVGNAVILNQQPGAEFISILHNFWP